MYQIGLRGRALTSSLDGALTSFAQGICDALTLTSSYRKRFPTPSPHLILVLELVQAQGCPVVRLGRIYICWLDKASFGPSCKPGSHTSGGFRIPVSLNEPPSMDDRIAQAEAVGNVVVVRSAR